MLRKLIAAGLVSLAVASCGSGSASPSASTPASASAGANVSPSADSAAPGTAANTDASATALPAGTMTASCDAVALRKKATTTAGLVARVAKGTQVHVAGTLEGAAYKPGQCGTSGTSWLKIDEVNGSTVQELFGTSFVYAAAGLFE